TPPEHQFRCSITLTKAGRELPGGDADGRSKPPKMTAMTRGFRSLYLLHQSMHQMYKNAKPNSHPSSMATATDDSSLHDHHLPIRQRRHVHHSTLWPPHDQLQSSMPKPSSRWVETHLNTLNSSAAHPSHLPSKWITPLCASNSSIRSHAPCPSAPSKIQPLPPPKTHLVPSVPCAAARLLHAFFLPSSTLSSSSQIPRASRPAPITWASHKATPPFPKSILDLASMVTRAPSHGRITSTSSRSTGVHTPAAHDPCVIRPHFISTI
ncbi:hypothetical protein ACLOJK_007360, partial [Asimina triloba]